MNYKRAAKATAVTVGVLLFGVACAFNKWVLPIACAVGALAVLWSAVYALSDDSDPQYPGSPLL